MARRERSFFFDNKTGKLQSKGKVLADATNTTNIVQTKGSTTGDPVGINAIGDDTNIDITIAPKGSGEVNIAAGNLNYGGTAITATGAELNILDGVTATTAELNILDGVTSTAAELNIIDGDTSATSTTLVDADRFVVNDAGTMVQVAASDVATYIGAATNVFTTVAVSGQNSIVADSNTDTLTVAAGDGITITTNDSTDTLTITAASSGDSAFERDADFGAVADSAGTTEDLGLVTVTADSTFELGTIAVQGIVVTSSIVDGAVTSAKLANDVSLPSISDGTSTLDFNGSNQVQSDASIVPNANGTLDLGTDALRWQNIYTSDLNLSNGVGDYTVVEGEEDLFLYNNKSGKVFKFALIEVDPSEATPKIEDLKNGD